VKISFTGALCSIIILLGCENSGSVSMSPVQKRWHTDFVKSCVNSGNNPDQENLCKCVADTSIKELSNSDLNNVALIKEQIIPRCLNNTAASAASPNKPSSNNAASKAEKTIEEWARVLPGMSKDSVMEMLGKPDDFRQNNENSVGIVVWERFTYEGLVASKYSNPKSLNIDFQYDKAKSLQVGYGGIVVKL